MFAILISLIVSGMTGSNLRQADFKATALDSRAVFVANTDLNSLTLPQTLSQGLFPASGAASEGAQDEWSRLWKSLWLDVIEVAQENQ